ncbi:complex I subunit 4 family protein [Flavobacterium silvaticum]|uniref:NADH-quinone oxidoreductase subunit M n=1 Tax=Flavobacterium silvaticum TaxID=1852020 RepID=A0A972FN15_9FLAO|nr:NADH-quinone oxidoreductase subunit M [Flavobacterium silvaticum]NMH28697.1 NADH-quinone oxidoreductase subunit M [Flavobacterium silvaticum]
MDVSIVLILLFAGALLSFLSGDKWASKTALLTSVVALGASWLVLCKHNAKEVVGVSYLWSQKPNIHVALSGDGLSLAMLMLTTALLPLIILSTFGRNIQNAKSFYSLIMFMGFAMAGTFLALDGFVYYIFWELALIPIYFIALLWGSGEHKDRQRAVVKFFIYTFAGSLFMLAAFAYLYTKAGSFMWTDLAKLDLSKTEQIWIFLAFFAAYAIKIPLIPFHTWQAAVYEKAPTAGTMLLSGIMLKMGLYSILRWQLPIAPLAAKSFMVIFIWFGLAGVLYGSVVALRQKNLKKLLAYSSLAHVGLIAAGAYTLNKDGLSGAVLQMISHGFAIVGLFLAADIIIDRLQTREISEMGGIRSQAPKFTSMFMIMVLASVALPTTFNFVGEFTVLYSLFFKKVWFAIIGGLTIILGAYYMLKMFQNVMLGETNKKPFRDVSWSEGLTFSIIIAVTFFFGLYPKPINDLIAPSIHQIMFLIHSGPRLL